MVAGFVGASNVSASVGIVGEYSPEAETLSDLEGWFGSFGLAGGPALRVLSADAAFGANSERKQISCYSVQIGVGPSALPVEVHGMVSYTMTLWKANINTPEGQLLALLHMSPALVRFLSTSMW